MLAGVVSPAHPRESPPAYHSETAGGWLARTGNTQTRWEQGRGLGRRRYADHRGHARRCRRAVRLVSRFTSPAMRGVEAASVPETTHAPVVPFRFSTRGCFHEPHCWG